MNAKIIIIQFIILRMKKNKVVNQLQVMKMEDMVNALIIQLHIMNAILNHFMVAKVTKETVNINHQKDT